MKSDAPGGVARASSASAAPMEGATSVLVVEDDVAIASGLALNLQFEGYATAVVHDGDAALTAIAERAPDLVVLDITLPSRSGLEVLGELRGRGDETPVIVLSARQDEHDKVAALRLGADDYVTKPFALAELLARVRAVLRRVRSGATLRPAERPPAPARFADVVIDRATRQVRRRGALVKLTHLEFELLEFFVAHASQVVSRERVLEKVWGVRHGGSARTVDNFVAQLRAKLEDDADAPRHFVTVRGSGYRFDP